MQPDAKILDDIARVAGGAVNIVSGLRQQARDEIKSRVDDMAARMDLVPREDLDRAEAQIGSLHAALEALTARVAALEGKAAKTTAKKTATAPKKPSRKKTEKAA